MTRYYSENGEDFLLDQLFKDRAQGVFVEVGCIDGRRHSNTLTFEERGWHGLCIEAHTGYIEMLQKNRPNSIICSCAVGEADQDQVTFYANRWGSLSSLDKSKEHEFKSRFGPRFAGFEEQIVQKRRLDTLFKTYGLTEIDILSIDIEGYEVEALKGLDFRQFRPLVLVIESESRAHRRRMDALLLPNGYIRSVRLAHNIFYLRDPRMERCVKGKVFSVSLNRTPHPLDDDEDMLITRTIDTRPVALLKQALMSKVHAVTTIFKG